MNEIPEIQAFLSGLPGFDQLDETHLLQAARAVSVAYYRRGQDILEIGTMNDELHVVRSGAVELRDQNDDLVTRLAEGECFGFPSLMNNAPTRNHSVAIEDTLIYHLAGNAFAALRRGNPDFDTWFIRALSDRLTTRPGAGPVRGTETRTVRQLVGRRPVTISDDATIRETARKMVEERVSAMLITEQGSMTGIVTDRDFRTRVVAEDHAPDRPVAEIMTRSPISLDADAHPYEAALVMMQNVIHHLPITDDDELIGMVARSDFMRLETEHPLYLVGDIGRQHTVDGLVEVCSRLPGLIAGQVQGDVAAEQLGKFITAITDSVTRQLISMVRDELGPPPCRYAWIALGSQARHEQSARSDQDNALVLEDGADSRAEAYFERLAEFVNAGLDRCGWVYCPGEVMASNPSWRITVSRWKEQFRQWITVPEEKALMHANIFFDLRTVDGDAELVEPIRESIREAAKKNELFLALMAKNAMNFQPPLGFFRQFVLEKSGEHKNTLNLKLHGIIPIVETARIRSLAAGRMRVSTRNRLQAAADQGELSQSDAESLIDALDLIEELRLEHQSRQMSRGEEPDNYLSPSELSPLARQNLKAAFSQIRTSQAALLNRFHLA
ncbi:putative nucleotidyltransferase substrate binding domain-containing protein [Lentisalinibacter salinarum]|uniref:putative nucleotidyltransferase substrate binding domain-containing protein n=1 Tax=Lentisalinibacter salinarum TaxID=2992239 RepID=UPI0038672903